jgi:hypothetical protein
MAIGGYAGDVSILDLSNGTWVASAQADEGIVFDVKWLRESRTIVSISGTSRENEPKPIIRWWDADTLAPKQSLLHPENWDDAVLSPCGRSAALLRGGAIRFLSLGDGTYWDLAADANHCAFSHSGELAAVSTGEFRRSNELQILSVGSRAVVQRIAVEDFLGTAGFTTDGSSLVTVETEGQVSIWNTGDWSCTCRFPTIENAKLLACDEARKIVAVYGYYEPEVGIFSMVNGERVAAFPAPDRPHVLVFDSGEQCIVCDNFDVVEAWDVNLDPQK